MDMITFACLFVVLKTNLSQCMRFPTMWYVRPARLRPACAYAQSDQSLCSSLEFSMGVMLLTEHLFEVLSSKEGYTGCSESTLVKMPHCWKSHVTAQFVVSIDISVCRVAASISVMCRIRVPSWLSSLFRHFNV